MSWCLPWSEFSVPEQGQDKQMVYLKFIVQIEDTGDVVTGQSTALCNRSKKLSHVYCL